MYKIAYIKDYDTPCVLGAKSVMSFAYGKCQPPRHRVFYIANPVLKRGRNKSGGGYEDLVKINKSMQRATPHDMVGDS
jgi:hypothetical protein